MTSLKRQDETVRNLEPRGRKQARLPSCGLAPYATSSGDFAVAALPPGPLASFASVNAFTARVRASKASFAASTSSGSFSEGPAHDMRDTLLPKQR